MASQAERRTATRGAILDAAGNLFSGQGFAATSVDAVAAAAGVAKGAVYHHFASKEAIFEAVCFSSPAPVSQTRWRRPPSM